MSLEFRISVCDACVCSASQACLTHCDPMNCSLPGSSVYGNFQTSILEWAAISYSRGSYQYRDRTQILWHLLHWQVNSLLLFHLGSLTMTYRPLLYHRLLLDYINGTELSFYQTEFFEGRNLWKGGITFLSPVYNKYLLYIR